MSGLTSLHVISFLQYRCLQFTDLCRSSVTHCVFVFFSFLYCSTRIWSPFWWRTTGPRPNSCLSWQSITAWHKVFLRYSLYFLLSHHKCMMTPGSLLSIIHTLLEQLPVFSPGEYSSGDSKKIYLIWLLFQVASAHSADSLSWERCSIRYLIS